jgi:hypothetical protein
VTFNVAGVESLHGKQIIVHLADEVTKSREKPDGNGTWVVRITADEAPRIIQALQQAYAETMQRALIEVAAGGCRTCNNTRRVNRAVMDLEGVTGEPCPVCIPRAEERIRKTLFLRQGRA